MPVSVKTISMAIVYLNSFPISLNTYSTTINTYSATINKNILWYR